MDIIYMRYLFGLWCIENNEMVHGPCAHVVLHDIIYVDRTLLGFFRGFSPTHITMPPPLDGVIIIKAKNSKEAS
jgi:hypothetical protein